MRKLAADTIPLGGIGQRILANGDHRPLPTQFSVQGGEMFLTRRHVVDGEDRLGRALWLTKRAVDALVGIDHQKIGTFVETVHRADFDTVSVLATDAVFGDDKGHGE